MEDRAMQSSKIKACAVRLFRSNAVGPNLQKDGSSSRQTARQRSRLTDWLANRERREMRRLFVYKGQEWSRMRLYIRSCMRPWEQHLIITRFDERFCFLQRTWWWNGKEPMAIASVEARRAPGCDSATPYVIRSTNLPLNHKLALLPTERERTCSSLSVYCALSSTFMACK